jgi:hypothetical protein
MPLHTDLKIDKSDGQYSCGKTDLFAIVIALCYLLPQEDFRIFYTSFKGAVGAVLNKSTATQEVRLVKDMGLPRCWREIFSANNF